MKKQMIYAAGVLAAVCLCLGYSDPVQAAAPSQTVTANPAVPFGFVQDENGVKWMNADGTWAVNCWVNYLGLTYHMDRNGYIQVGLQTIDGKTYYLNPNGTMIKGWLEIGDGLYFFYEDGTMAKDVVIGPYEFGKDGKLLSALNTESEMQVLINSIIKTVTTDDMDQKTKLRACYDFILNHCSYKRTYETPAGDWTETFAKEILTTGKGNCYRYAAAFGYLARGLGYEEVHVATGQIKAARGGVTPHGWTEIKIDGVWYLFDPDMEDAKPGRDYYYKTEEKYPTKPLIKEAEWPIEF